MRTVARMLLAVLAILMPAMVSAQPPDMVQWYGNAYTMVTRNYRDQIRPLLTPAEQRVLNDIVFRFNSDQQIYARAYVTDDGQRFVELSLGFLSFMESLIIAYSISGETEQYSCFEEYLDLVARLHLSNEKARRDNAPLTLIPFIGKYVRDKGKGCETMPEEQFQNPEVLEFIPGAMNSVLAMAAGHEVAHHVLGHFEAQAPNTGEQSRVAEMAADDWALRHACAIGIVPSPATPMWLFYAKVGGGDVGAELQSTHPLGARRHVHALDAIIAFMRSPDYEKIFGRKAEEWMVEDFQKTRDQLSEQLPE